MGRRKRTKRGSYQSLSDIQEDNAMRAAEANITYDGALQAAADNILSDIRGEVAIDSAMQDAMDYLPTRRAQLSAMQAPESHVLELAELAGGVPAAISHTDRETGSERRTHVEYDINPITGQQEVVPIMNPDRPQEVLRTTYGVLGIDPEAGHQSEPAMANALRLLGYKVGWNDPTLQGVNRAGRPYTYTEGKADLRASKEDHTLYADVMVDRNYEPTVPIPLYTSLVPSQGGGAQVARQLIEKQLSQQPSTGLYDTIEDMVASGVLNPPDDRRFGKLARADANNFAGDALYDILLMPGYDRQVMSLKGEQSPQQMPTAPSSISLVNLKKALMALNEGKAETVKMNKNYSASGRGYERLQVKPRFGRTSEVGITDAVEQYPILQQLLA